MKKLFLFIFLSLLLTLSLAQVHGGPSEEEQPTPSGYTPIEESEVNTNPQLQGLLYIGVQNATQQAIQDGSLPEGNYQVAEIISVEQNQDVTETDDYRFQVQVSDGQDNDATIVFLISYDSSEGSSEVTSYEVLDGSDNDDYTDLDPSVIDTNAQIRGLLTLGLQNVTEQAIEDGALPEGDYQLAGVNSLEQSTTDPNHYRFDVNMASDQGDEVRILCVLAYDSENGRIEVVSYEVIDDDTETGETESEGEWNEFGEGEFEGGEQTEDGFIVLDPSVADTDPLIRGILLLGVQEATRQAIANGSLYDSDYELADVHSIEQGIEDPENYRFDVSVKNDLENIVRMNFDLLFDSTSNSVDVLSFGYPNTTIPDGGENEETTPIPEEEVSIIPEEEVSIIPEEQEESSTNTTLPVGYVELTEDDVDELVEQIGDAGFKAAALKGLEDGLIPPSHYNSGTVYSVAKRVAIDTEYYRFDLDAADELGNSARFTYTVAYIPAVGSMALYDSEITNIVRATSG